MTIYILPSLLIFVLIYGKFKKVHCYDTFVKGAGKGLHLAIDLFAYIAAIMICVAVLRASGITNSLIHLCRPVFNFLGIPTEIIELVLLKPFSGSGSIAILENIISTYGADSYISRCACVIAGSSETTFYVASVYFGAVGIKKFRHALLAGILADIIGLIAAVWICSIFFL